METRTKYQLPSVAPIPGIKFDVEKLRQEVARLNEEWVNVYPCSIEVCVQCMKILLQTIIITLIKST